MSGWFPWRIDNFSSNHSFYSLHLRRDSMMNRSHRSTMLPFVLLIALALLGTMILGGCAEKQDSSSGPVTTQTTETLGKENPQVKSVMLVQDRHTAALMADKN